MTTYPEALAEEPPKSPDNSNIRAAAAELRRLHADAEESEALRERLSELLRNTAIALRGPEPELTRWSWHDLPELATALKAQRDALLETLRHAAAIAHSGGLQGMTEWQSLVAVRRLTQPYFERSGSITETHDRLLAAIKAVEENT